LKRCALTTLEKRRSRGDLIEAYKIITGKEAIQWERFFELGLSKVTWRHMYKLLKKRKRTLGRKFFSARVTTYGMSWMIVLFQWIMSRLLKIS